MTTGFVSGVVRADVCKMIRPVLGPYNCGSKTVFTTPLPVCLGDNLEERDRVRESTVLVEIQKLRALAYKGVLCPHIPDSRHQSAALRRISCP